MDTLRGEFSGQDGPESGLSGEEDTGVQAPPAKIGGDERRMQVRAYNFWASLLGNRTFPQVSDLHPDRLPDFGPYSVLLDFTDGIANPAIAYLGAKLATECDMDGTIRRLDDVPSRSLLSRITDHYMQILANQAPIGFEAEFINQRGVTILYRGIMLPFARDDATIDFIYGVINWKEQAEPSVQGPVADAPFDSRPAMLRDGPLTAWADGPADLGFGDDTLGFGSPGFVPMELPLAQFGMHGDYFDNSVLPREPGEMELGDWLAAAREEARHAHASDDRSRQSLYAALGRAYDFALAAAEAPADYAELIEDAGIKAQERAPLIPLVKLVFGADYDKTRLTEFATCIAHGQRLGLERGALAGYLGTASGGLKAIVAEERRLRRAESGTADKVRSARETRIEALRHLQPRALDTVGRDGEFTVLVARRQDDGRLVLLGEVADDAALLDRAARHLLG